MSDQKRARTLQQARTLREMIAETGTEPEVLVKARRCIEAKSRKGAKGRKKSLGNPAGEALKDGADAGLVALAYKGLQFLLALSTPVGTPGSLYAPVHQAPGRAAHVRVIKERPPSDPISRGKGDTPPPGARESPLDLREDVVDPSVEVGITTAVASWMNELRKRRRRARSGEGEAEEEGDSYWSDFTEEGGWIVLEELVLPMGGSASPRIVEEQARLLEEEGFADLAARLRSSARRPKSSPRRSRQGK